MEVLAPGPTLGGKMTWSDLSAAMASDPGCLRTGLLERAVILRVNTTNCSGLGSTVLYGWSWARLLF
jgi:hypothetical protein